MFVADRMQGVRRSTIVVLAAVTVLVTVAQGAANDEVPHETRGHARSGYQLSDYENINLANGNLTFTIPLATVRTDGGLEYPVALRHNSKVWFTSRYCSLVPQGYEDCLDGGGEFLDVRIAHGVDEFGFGWDLRPPRVVLFRQSPFPRGMALVDDTGARHSLSTAPPWLDPGGEQPAGSEAAEGDRFFTRDGSNLRFTVTEVDDAGRPLAFEMENGDGTVYLFAHVVPTACDADRPVGLSDEDLEDFNFRVETAGLYLSEIRRGPWRAAGGDAEPANRVTFSYRGQAAGWDSPCGGPGGEQWLPTGITASGEVPREVRIHYDAGTSAVSAVEIPRFDAVIGNHGPSGEWDEIRLTVGSETFEQRNGGRTLTFEAAHLERVTFPNGATFELDTLPSSGSPPLSDVVLPSGARVLYGRGWYPVGKGRCLDGLDEGGGECRVWATCGAAIPRPGEAMTAELRAEGVGWREVEYLDAATTDGNPRVESTWFAQGLNCAVSPSFTKPPNELHAWPYDLDWALRDDRGVLLPEYLWTVVYTFAGAAGAVEKPEVQIHRFHPLTREEFSVDYLAGGDDDLAVLPLAALSSGTEDLRGTDIRVLRHTEIERGLRFGFDWPTVTEGDDRYSYIRETRVHTDELSGDAGLADVESCYAPVFADLMGPGDPIIDCTEVRDTREVDAYLNPTARAVVSRRSASGVEVARDWGFEYLEDGAEDSWFLHRETANEVCEGSHCTRHVRRWANLSDPGAPAFWAAAGEVRNPDAGGGCSADCVETALMYDPFGNLEASTVRGGYGSGFGMLELTTRTVHRHGVPVAKELQAPGGSLVLWQREADPGTGRYRWHLSGSGDGFAYLWDGTGRLTDLAPVEGDLVSEQWQLEVQRASDGSAMLGSHVDYRQPAGEDLLRHEVREAGYELQGGDQPRLVITSLAFSPERTFHFDGRGRLTRRVERYPGGSGTRSRLELDVFDDGSSLCGTGQGTAPAFATRIALRSEWQDDAQWSSCEDLQWTETSLDGFGRPATIVLPDGGSSQLAWVGDSLGIVRRSVATATDGGEHMVATFRLTDALGRLRVVEEEVTPGESVSADLDWDLEDRLREVRLWQGAPFQSPEQRRSFSYSDAGFLISSSQPERSVLFTGYDARGNLVESVTAGVATWLGYDLVGRLVSRWTGGIEVAWWVWGDDQPGSSARPGEPSYGRIVRALRHNRFGGHDVPVTTTWRYDGPGGRVSTRRVSVDGLGLLGDGFTTAYGYDRRGHASTVGHPAWDGWAVSCQDPVTERHHRVGDWLVGSELAVGSQATPVAGMERSFHPTGRAAATEFLRDGAAVGGLDEHADPHGMARAAGYELRWNGSGTLWDEGPYGYDGSGNVSRVGSRRFAYDGLDRLVAFADGGAPVEGYRYDRWGNITEIRNQDIANGGGYTLRLLGTAGDNRPMALEVVGEGTFPVNWDARGNLTSLPATSAGRGKSFVFSGDDRLLQVTDTASGTRWRNAYDAGGERVLSWRRDGDGQLAEVRLNVRDEAGSVLSDWLLVPGSSFAPTRDYLRVDGRLAIQLDHAGGVPVALFAAHDHLGSTRALVTADGALADVLEYLPYGGLRSGGPVPGTSHLFTGHERELGSAASELDFMHARHYSPLLGRFTSIDVAGGGDPASSQSWNRYAYTAGNPLRAVDPDGRYRRDVHFNLTKALAIAAGFPELQAVGIAADNQMTDRGIRSSTSVFGMLRGSAQEYHFTTPVRRRELRTVARASGDREDLGRYLHALQDSYSHASYGPAFGHLFAGTAPDVTANDSEKAMRMARATFAELRDFRGGNAAVEFSEIEDLVEEFVRLPEEEEAERMKILARIEELASERRSMED